VTTLLRAPLVLVLLLLLAGCTTPPAEQSLGPDRSFTGWQLVTTPAARLNDVCQLRPDGTLAVAGQPSGYLATTAVYRNYQLHVEWRWTGKPGNSGILVHIASGPKDRVWPRCHQIQTKHTCAGDLLPMAGATGAELPAGAKQISHQQPSSEKPAGEWNTCDLVCRGDTIECAINGVRQNRLTHCVPAAGQIGFQLEGAPYELRHLRLTPLAD